MLLLQHDFFEDQQSLFGIGAKRGFREIQPFATLTARFDHDCDEAGLVMSKKLVLTFLLLSLASLLAFVVFRSGTPIDVIEPKGPDSSVTVQYVSLATAVVSLATAIVGLMTSIKKDRAGQTR